MIVVDVGCARYGGDHSIEKLLERFDPDEVYGFDPAWKPEMFRPTRKLRAMITVSNEAAMTWDGHCRFLADGLNGKAGGEHIHWDFVPCIDLARFIDELPAGELVLKLDCEGSEYALVKHLIETKVDLRLNRLLVEWHCAECGKGHGWHTEECSRPKDPRPAHLERKLTCPVEEWAG